MYSINDYLKRHLYTKRNFILFSLLFCLFLIVYIGITFSSTYIKIGNYMTNKKYGLSNLHVVRSDNDYSILSNMEHVVNIVSHKSYGELYLSDINNINTEIRLVSLLDNNILDIKYGRNIKQSDELVCNNTFYPYTPILSDNDISLDRDLIIHGKDIFKNVFTFRSLNQSDDNEHVFKIVGTYDGTSMMDSLNTCYASPDIIEKLNSPCNGYIVNEVVGGEEIICDNYDGVVIRIDSIDNISLVKNKLKDMGYSVFQYDVPDEEGILLFSYGPLTVIIFILLISLIVIENIIKKKIIERKKYYGILKVSGFDNNMIISIDLKENLIVIISSSILSFIIFAIGFTILKYNIFDSFLYEGFNLNIPLLAIFIFLGIYILILNFIIRYKLKNMCNHNITFLLGE